MRPAEILQDSFVVVTDMLGSLPTSMLMSVMSCDLNRSTQHSKLLVQRRSVADETKTSDDYFGLFLRGKRIQPMKVELDVGEIDCCVNGFRISMYLNRQVDD